jgi:RNA polymerase sigma factor (sigma-70 family)
MIRFRFWRPARKSLTGRQLQTKSRQPRVALRLEALEDRTVMSPSPPIAEFFGYTAPVTNSSTSPIRVELMPAGPFQLVKSSAESGNNNLTAGLDALLFDIVRGSDGGVTGLWSVNASILSPDGSPLANGALLTSSPAILMADGAPSVQFTIATVPHNNGTPGPRAGQTSPPVGLYTSSDFQAEFVINGGAATVTATLPSPNSGIDPSFVLQLAPPAIQVANSFGQAGQVPDGLPGAEIALRNRIGANGDTAPNGTPPILGQPQNEPNQSAVPPVADRTENDTLREIETSDALWVVPPAAGVSPLPSGQDPGVSAAANGEAGAIAGAFAGVGANTLLGAKQEGEATGGEDAPTNEDARVQTVVPSNGHAMAELPDATLLKRFVANRDQAAFAALVQRHQPFVLGISQRVLGDPHAAEDTVQATFLVLARKACMIDGRNPLAGWLYKVAYHLALRARAVAARKLKWEKNDSNGYLSLCEDEAWVELEQEEMRRALYAELQDLPDKYRVPLVLCYLEGRTHAQAAEEIGMPRGSMAKRIGKALDLLRQRLIERGVIY